MNIIAFIIRNSSSWSQLAISLIVADCKLLLPITVFTIFFIFFNTISIKTPMIMYSIRSYLKASPVRNALYMYSQSNGISNRHFMFESTSHSIHYPTNLKVASPYRKCITCPTDSSFRAHDIKSCWACMREFYKNT